MNRRALAPVIALALTVSAAPLFALETIGKAAAVRSEAKGTPPGEAERALATGIALHAQERVVTSPTGDLQVLFEDESTLSVGPGSDLVLDEFVYDPGRTEKSLSVTLRRGAARLIGGRVTKDGDAEIHTPNATIAIRGGIALVGVSGEESRGILGLGTLTCIGSTETVVLTIPGMICIIGQGVEVRRATQDEIAAALAALVGSGKFAGRVVDPREVVNLLAIDCGGEASLNDPRCIAEKGFAGVDPEPLGAPRLWQHLADLAHQLQDPRGSLASPPDVGEDICDLCLR